MELGNTSLSSLQLDAFTAVAKTLHFSQAAKSLHITQSALSQRIRNLEDDIGAPLLTRDRNNVQLSEIGERLLRYCQLKRDMEGAFLEELSDPDSLGGVVRVAGFSSVTRSLILPALADLLRSNPRLRLELVNRELRELPDLLRQAYVDFVILDRPIERDNIESHFVGFERNVLVTSATRKSPDIYLDHDARDETTFNYFQMSGVCTKNLRRRYLDEVYALIDGVRLGLGKAVLPMHLIHSFNDIKVIDPDIQLKIPLYLNYFEQPCYTSLQQRTRDALLNLTKEWKS